MRRAGDGPARAVLRRPVRQPRRPAAAASSGMPGLRDQHTGCVGALPGRARPVRLPAASRCPTTTPTRTSTGPHAQIASIAEADRQLERAHARRRRASTRFLDEHAVIVVADHSHAAVERHDRPRRGAFADWRRAARPTGARSRRATAEHRASARPSASAMVYVLDPERRDGAVPRSVARGRARSTASTSSMRRDGDGDGGVALPARGELRFRARRRRSRDARGARWTVDGDARGARRARRRRRAARRPTTPTRSRRVWAALTCPTSGDVLLSAAPG